MHPPTLVACLLSIAVIVAGEIDNEHLKCLVCRATMKEVKNELSKIDPKRKIDVGNYRLDAEGNEIKKTISMARSAVHISDVLDGACDKMSDYVRATDKKTGRLMIFNLMSPSGNLNSIISNVDIIQDGDLNKSLEHLCKEVLSEDEDDMIKFFQNEKNHDTDLACNNVCDETMTLDETVEEAGDAAEKTGTEKNEL